MCVLTCHGNQKWSLGHEAGFVLVCVGLLMAICFNYIMDLFASALCTVLLIFHSFQEPDRGRLISSVHAVGEEFEKLGSTNSALVVS